MAVDINLIDGAHGFLQWVNLSRTPRFAGLTLWLNHMEECRKCTPLRSVRFLPKACLILQRCLRGRLLARVAHRRQSDVAREGDAERAGRAVADAPGQRRPRRRRRARSRLLAERHAPRQQVLHRRDAHRAAEALEEGRARQRGFLRQLRDGPRLRSVFSCMARIATARRSSASPRSRPGDAAVPAVERSASISSTSSSRARMTSRAGPPRARFVADQLHERGQPLLAAHVHQLRQQRHQQRRVRRTEDAVADQQQHVGAARPASPILNSPWRSATGTCVSTVRWRRLGAATS